MKVLFYLDEKKLSPRGGPYGVGYYYWEEMKRHGDTIIDFMKKYIEPYPRNAITIIRMNFYKFTN